MSENRTKTRKSEEVRIRHLYRSLILHRKIKLPHEAAVKLVGPDCAYHLYAVFDATPRGSVKAARKQKKKADWA
jgi:hypothetical protein